MSKVGRKPLTAAEREERKRKYTAIRVESVVVLELREVLSALTKELGFTPTVAQALRYLIRRFKGKT